MSLSPSRSNPAWRLLVAVLAVGLLVFGLAACGGDSDTSESTTAATTESEGNDSGGAGATGVTDTTLRVGFIIEDIPADNAFPYFFREDAQEAVEAMVKQVNDEGGVAGREIEGIYTHIPPGPDTTPSHEACLQLTKKDKVFVIVGGYVSVYANDCFIKEGKTPLIDMVALTDEANEAYGGYHMTPSPSFTRTAKDWVYGGDEIGMFDPDNGFTKLGTVEQTCEKDIWDNPENGIKAWLKTVGVGPDQISEFAVDCTPEGLLSGHEAALLKHKQDGVSTVMIAAQPLDRNYTALAQKQGFDPEYLWGDFHFATQAANGQSLNQDAADGSYGITAFRQDTEAPAAQKCEEALVAAGLPGFEAIQSDLLVLNFCTQLNILKAVAEKAGDNLTQESFVEAAPTVGQIPSAVELEVNFDGDTTGGEKYQVVKWDSSSTSWIPEGEPKPSSYTPGETVKDVEG